MARPREFEADEAIVTAMHQFWRCGYEATSVDDLTRELGIGRGSLYGAFGSKDELYQRALERYRQDETQRALACLGDDGSASERIASLFERFASDALSDPENRGCFILNAAAERAPHDPETSRQVRAAIGSFEAALTTLVRDGQGAGEISDAREPRELARFLVSCLNGVRVTAKATQDPALVRDAVSTTLAVLEP